MKWDVLFTDEHIEVVEASSNASSHYTHATIAELIAVNNHPGTSRVVNVRPHIEMVELSVGQDKLDYIQRAYERALPSTELFEFDDGWVRGIEFVVRQLNLPIRIRH